jgi:hypothetical protein
MLGDMRALAITNTVAVNNAADVVTESPEKTI